MTFVLIDLGLFILNGVLAFVAFDDERYGQACFSAFVAGVCLMGMIAALKNI